jgi:predicted PP-loop superfamily ATPase
MYYVGFLFSALLSLVVAGCVSPGLGVRKLYVDQGTQVYEASCNGTRHTVGDCKSQAYETCQGRFKELSKDSRDTAMVVSGTMYPIINRSLQFVCDN